MANDNDDLLMAYELLANQRSAQMRSPQSYRYRDIPARMQDEMPTAEYGLVPDYPWNAPRPGDLEPVQRPLREAVRGGVPGPSPAPVRGLNPNPGWIRGMLPTLENATAAAGRARMEGSVMDDRSFGQKVADAVLALGRPDIVNIGQESEVPQPYDVAEGFFNPAGVGVKAMAGILAGRKARLAPLSQMNARQDYAVQQALKRETYDPQEAWKRYGVELGSEGNPRWEIPDDPSRFKYDELSTLFSKGSGIPLGLLFEHPQLFENYPQLRKMLIYGQNVDDPLMAGGTYFHKGSEPSIMLRSSRDTDASTIQSTLLHELQHAVQGIENFPRGGSTQSILSELTTDEISRLTNDLRNRAQQSGKSVRDIGVSQIAGTAYNRLAGEVEARNVQGRWRDQDLRRFTPSITEDVPRLLQIKKYN